MEDGVTTTMWRVSTQLAQSTTESLDDDWPVVGKFHRNSTSHSSETTLKASPTESARSTEAPIARGRGYAHRKAATTPRARMQYQPVREREQQQQQQQQQADTTASSTSSAVVTAAVSAQSAAPAVKVPVRFFVIKSFDQNDVDKSMAEGIWATQRRNTSKLNSAFDSAERVVLFFSVNASKAFQGYCVMTSKIGSETDRDWFTPNGDVWGGVFRVRWDKMTELPFSTCTHLRNPLNQNKPVKISRDGQEIPAHIGTQLLELFHSSLASSTSSAAAAVSTSSSSAPSAPAAPAAAGSSSSTASSSRSSKGSSASSSSSPLIPSSSDATEVNYPYPFFYMDYPYYAGPMPYFYPSASSSDPSSDQKSAPYVYPYGLYPSYGYPHPHQYQYQSQYRYQYRPKHDSKGAAAVGRQQKGRQPTPPTSTTTSPSPSASSTTTTTTTATTAAAAASPAVVSAAVPIPAVAAADAAAAQVSAAAVQVSAAAAQVSAAAAHTESSPSPVTVASHSQSLVVSEPAE